MVDTPAQALVSHEARELKRAAQYANAAKSEATRRSYQTDFQSFAAWCADRKPADLPADCETVCGHLSMLADRGKTTSTIRRSLATITHSHRLSGHEPSQEEAVRSVTAGIHRKLGVKPERQDPITSDVVRKILKLHPRYGSRG